MMTRLLQFLIVASLLISSVSGPVWAADDEKEADADMKLPRFAMLASPEVNLRTGPGTRYPIDWIIRRKGLPVEIVQQFEHWRKVKTPDGTTGWAHKVMLNSYRALVITGTQPQVMFAQPDLKSRVQARIEPEVIGRLERCKRDWCQAKIQGYEGWLPKEAFWGVYPDETFDD